MSTKPVAAGKSSIDIVDKIKLFDNIITDVRGAYLDLACGEGRYTVELATRLDNKATVYAFDLWRDGISKLKNYAQKNELECIKAEVIDITLGFPLKQRAVDVCLFATALHDIPESKRRNVVKEIFRVLNSNGMLALIEFKKVDHGPGPDINERIDEKDADALILPHGFIKGEVSSLGEYTYLVKYLKK